MFVIVYLLSMLPLSGPDDVETWVRFLAGRPGSEKDVGNPPPEWYLPVWFWPHDQQIKIHADELP